MIIELKPIKKNQNKLYGKNFGEMMREKFDLNTLDKQNEVVFVHISPKLYSLNKDFFMGMFAKSVKALTVDGFRTKYVFNTRPANQRNIAEWMVQALYETV